MDEVTMHWMRSAMAVKPVRHVGLRVIEKW